MGYLQTMKNQIRRRKNAASDQVLLCLLTEGTFRIWMKLKHTIQQPLNSKWIRIIDKGEKFR